MPAPMDRANEIRLVIEQMQVEAVNIYLICRRAAERGLVSPYAHENYAHRLSRARK